MDAFSYTVYKDKSIKGIKMNWQEQIIESACGASGDISVDLVIEILTPYIESLEQAVSRDGSEDDEPQTED